MNRTKQANKQTEKWSQRESTRNTHICRDLHTHTEIPYEHKIGNRSIYAKDGF